jgi:hypothetical protein
MRKKRRKPVRTTANACQLDRELFRKLRSPRRDVGARSDDGPPIERFAKLASNSTIWCLNAGRLYVAASVLLRPAHHVSQLRRFGTTNPDRALARIGIPCHQLATPAEPRVPVCPRVTR